MWLGCLLDVYEKIIYIINTQISLINLKFSGSLSALSKLYLYFRCQAVFEILEL